MIDYIKKLKHKDEDAKKRIMFFGMVGGMALVIAFWVAIMPYEFGLKNKNVAVKETDKAVPPFAVLRDNLKKAYGNASATALRVYDNKTGVEIGEETKSDLPVVDLEVVEQ